MTNDVAWSAMEGESIHVVTWPSLHGNANNCRMVFDNDFTSDVAINKNIVPMQHLSRSKAHAKTELIAEVYRNLDLDELNSSMNLECLELGPLDCEYVKSPIPNMVCENNHVGSESESSKNRGKKGYKEQTIKIRPS